MSRGDKDRRQASIFCFIPANPIHPNSYGQPRNIRTQPFFANCIQPPYATQSFLFVPASRVLNFSQDVFLSMTICSKWDTHLVRFSNAGLLQPATQHIRPTSDAACVKNVFARMLLLGAGGTSKGATPSLPRGDRDRARWERLGVVTVDWFELSIKDSSSPPSIL